VLARSNATGTIFLANLGFDLPSFSETDQVHIRRSVDNGATFRPSVDGAPGFVRGVDFQGKDWLAVDNLPGPGHGNVYLTWRDFSADPARDGIIFTRSTDDGRTWGPNGGTVIDTIGARDELANELPFVTVGPDHAVYVF